MFSYRRLTKSFLTFFGDLKIYPFPMWLLYDPGSYLVRGDDARRVIELVAPGDILVRGYRRYLDGYFIPGAFSHAGLYLGPVTDADRSKVATSKGQSDFRTGTQQVMHSMAHGVFMEDVLTFCRCDYLLILRFPDRMIKGPDSTTIAFAADPPIGKEKELRDRLVDGHDIEFTEAWPVIRDKALSYLGRGYDFGFDFNTFDKLSCTEFVYLATRALAPFLQVRPVSRRILFANRQMIIPDAFLESGLKLVWASPSSAGKLGRRMKSTPDG